MSNTKQHKVKDVRFAEFWFAVAADLGSSRIRLNHEATSIHEFINKDSDARRYLQNAIKASYKASKCQHLKSPIDLEVLLDILGDAAFTLQGDQRDDLFDIELLEEIAWHVSSRYQHELKNIILDWSNRYDCNVDLASKQANGCRVLSFPNYKIRRANTLL